jgi:hypothetical protein
MRVTAEIHYSADPATVFEMLTDKAFQDRKLSETGALSWDARVQREGDAAVIVSHRELSTDIVPDSFRSMVGQQITIVQTERWGPARADGSRTGTLEVEVGAAPVKLTAALTLAATSTGTTQSVDGELKARVPLLGGKIERSVEPAVRAAITAEERIGQAWLAER